MKKRLVLAPRKSVLWFPCGETIRYACLKCGGTLASLAQASTDCDCGNVRIEDGRVALQNATQFRDVIEVAQSALVRPVLPAWNAGISVHQLQDDCDV